MPNGLANINSWITKLRRNLKSYRNKEQKWAMLGTSFQLWRSELSPIPEFEDEVVDPAYFLARPMARPVILSTGWLLWPRWEPRSRRAVGCLFNILIQGCQMVREKNRQLFSKIRLNRGKNFFHHITPFLCLFWTFQGRISFGKI